MIKSLGIVGMGFVGSAVHNAFDGYLPIKRFDINLAKSDSLVGCLSSDAIFLCLPTPMRPTGACDLSILTGFLERASVWLLEKGRKPIFILKSTVPIGTTRHLIAWGKDWGRFIHNPEFLTERNANDDFIAQPFICLGGNDRDALVEVEELYRTRLGNRRMFVSFPETTETAKLAINAGLALRVAYFNELNSLATAVHVPWNDLVSIVTADTRIGTAHSFVPGPDGLHGFGGKCLPKDLCSLIHQCIHHDVAPDLWIAAWSRNLAVRERRDWEDIPWATSKET